MIQAIWVLLGHLPALLLWALTRCIPNSWERFAQDTPGQVAGIVTGFAFTMMGFLVAALMVLSLFSESRAVRRYRSGPYAKVLIVHVGLTLLELAIVFGLAFSLVLTPASAVQVKWVAIMAIGCLGMTLLCCLPILKVQYTAAHEHHLPASR
jgi:hypothetical protein